MVGRMSGVEGDLRAEAQRRSPGMPRRTGGTTPRRRPTSVERPAHDCDDEVERRLLLETDTNDTLDKHGGVPQVANGILACRDLVRATGAIWHQLIRAIILSFRFLKRPSGSP